VTAEETPFDIALREAKVLTFIRCGGSGGRCNAVYGAIVDDGTDDPPVLYRSGQPCHHHVNAMVLDWTKVNALVAKGRIGLNANRRAPSYHLPVLPGRQPSPLEQARLLEAVGKAELHEHALNEGPNPIASRIEDT
jgi:hypothetical protein